MKGPVIDFPPPLALLLIMQTKGVSVLGRRRVTSSPPSPRLLVFTQSVAISIFSSSGMPGIPGVSAPVTEPKMLSMSDFYIHVWCLVVFVEAR